MFFSVFGQTQKHVLFDSVFPFSEVLYFFCHLGWELGGDIDALRGAICIETIADSGGLCAQSGFQAGRAGRARAQSHTH